MKDFPCNICSNCIYSCRIRFAEQSMSQRRVCEAAYPEAPRTMPTRWSGPGKGICVFPSDATRSKWHSWWRHKPEWHSSGSSGWLMVPAPVPLWRGELFRCPFVMLQWRKTSWLVQEAQVMLRLAETDNSGKNSGLFSVCCVFVHWGEHTCAALLCEGCRWSSIFFCNCERMLVIANDSHGSNGQGSIFPGLRLITWGF